MPSTRLLVLGTHNHKKLQELQNLLAAAGIQLRTLADFSSPLAIPETETTFAGNARLKATRQAPHLGHWVLAEDSGLMVDALDGAPGTRSARFAGEQATDSANNDLLLARLSGITLPQRTAHYACHVTLSDPQGVVRAECAGECRGRIREQPAGTSGFGYDPLFEVMEYHRTFAELGESVKSMISHRGRALRLMIRQLLPLLAGE
jgi:XTP/dITP diphosphohydrolase